MYFKQFEQAIDVDDIDAVRHLFSLKANPNECSDAGSSLLKFAIKRHRNEIIEILLDHGADSNLSQKDCLTPLADAVYFRNYDACELLLKNRADVNAYGGKPRKTALHVSCINNCEAHNIIKKLLEYNADVNAVMKTARCATPLHLAARKNYWKSVSILLNYGANQNLKTLDGQETALEVACKASAFNVYDILLPITSELNLDRMLRHFIADDNVDRVLELLKLRLYPNSRFDENAALSLRASDCKFDKVVDDKGSALLQIACRNGCAKNMFDIMIEYGCPVDIFDEYGSIPLHYACSGGYRDMFKILIDHGSSVNVPDAYGKLPLHYACSGGNLDMVRTLLKHDSLVNIADQNGEIPLHKAFYVFGRNYITMTIIETLIEHNSSINIPNNYGDIPLHDACTRGDIKIVKTLIENGSFINIYNKDKKLPLHHACNRGYSDVIKILLLNGADLKIEEFKEPIVNQCSKKAVEVKATIQKFLTPYNNPKSLKKLVRDNIHNRLIEHSEGADFKKKVDQLPLPKLLKAYIFTLFET